MKRVCVFCGSRNGTRDQYVAAARRMGEALARRGIGLVYGGGGIGLMGVLADAAVSAGGDVIGVIPEALMAREVAHRGLPDLRVVASMHERKALMAELADAFVALPGGFGTLEEFCEALTWAQLGIHRKPCGLLNVEGFFDPLLSLFDHAVRERFVSPDHRSLVVVEEDPERLLDALSRWEPPALERWMGREEI
ncbi:MAG: TIGR00730 family Rossman fold protein [Candidatus Rokuibacteriota bacterium]